MSDHTKLQSLPPVIVTNESFVNTAESLKPTLIKKVVKPQQIVDVIEDSKVIHGWRTVSLASIEKLSERDFGKGESIILDFGDHRVGYVSFDLRAVGSPPDAPLKLKLTFGEMPVEMAEPFSNYSGWISSSWLQEEIITIDVLPCRLEMPRRYSFRYLKLEVLDTSTKYRVAFDHIICQTVTSADTSKVEMLNHTESLMNDLDRVSIRTLEDCMQDVFEDGPKRDRRLWLGDLRLQAMANYETFRNYDLVKRCLYLFASVPDERGRVSSNLFIEPKLIADDTYLFDYSLFFTTSLYDYFIASKDKNTLKELWPTARRQVELAFENLDENGVVKDQDSWWSFIDWNQELNKQAPSHAVLIYSLKRALYLAEKLGCDSVPDFTEKLRELQSAAMAQLWDSNSGFFVSGADRQVSWASQVWFTLAEVLPEEENRALMHRLLSAQPTIGLATPYMYHHLVEALLVVGYREEAIVQMKSYWGEMLSDGADTFWELYDPKNKGFSPYGSHLINSYCHAWSCTPTYLIRQYGL